MRGRFLHGKKLEVDGKIAGRGGQRECHESVLGISVDLTLKALGELHPYTVPEIIALPVIEGFEGYLGWLEEETAKERG